LHLAAGADVVAHGDVEQEPVLRHHPDPGLARGPGDLAQIEVLDDQTTRLRVRQAREQLAERRLA
jgi:hypothetical protein